LPDCAAAGGGVDQFPGVGLLDGGAGQLEAVHVPPRSGEQRRQVLHPFAVRDMHCRAAAEVRDAAIAQLLGAASGP
jgi:hypothetical protein